MPKRGSEMLLDFDTCVLIFIIFGLLIIILGLILENYF